MQDEKRNKFFYLMVVSAVLIIAILAIAVGRSGDIAKTPNNFNSSFNEIKTDSETFGDEAFYGSTNETSNTSNSPSNTPSFKSGINLKEPPPEVVGAVNI